MTPFDDLLVHQILFQVGCDHTVDHATGKQNGHGCDGDTTQTKSEKDNVAGSVKIAKRVFLVLLENQGPLVVFEYTRHVNQIVAILVFAGTEPNVIFPGVT